MSIFLVWCDAQHPNFSLDSMRKIVQLALRTGSFWHTQQKGTETRFFCSTCCHYKIPYEMASVVRIRNFLNIFNVLIVFNAHSGWQE